MSLSERHIGWTALACLGLTAWLSAAPAAAQPTQEQQNAIRSSCRSDYMSNCSSVKPGGVEALQCLQRNAAKLSPGCQTAVNAISPPAAPAQHAAPAAAPATQAPAVAARPATTTMPAPAPVAPTVTPPNPPVPRQPVRAATAPAAAHPAAAHKPTSQQQAAIRQSCQSDFMSRCSGVQPGGADALRCLQRNSAQLSPNCRTAVAAIGGSAPAAATTASAAAPAPASAPTPEQQSAIKLTCRRDFMSNCRGVTPGGAEAFACLQRNAARLSPDCKTSLAAIADGSAPSAATSAATAPAAPAARPGPIGPLRRSIRERMMKQ